VGLEVVATLHATFELITLVYSFSRLKQRCFVISQTRDDNIILYH